MKRLSRYLRYGAATAVLLVALAVAARANAQNDQLPSWNDGPAARYESGYLLPSIICTSEYL